VAIVPELVDTLSQLGQNLLQLLTLLVQLVGLLLGLIVQLALLLAWLAWVLFAINWKKMWPTLAAGAWAPFVLLVVLAALVWAALEPTEMPFLGLSLANFWWQLGVVSFIAGLTLFVGWFQGVLGYTPPEITLDVPAHSAHDEPGPEPAHAHH
jgi:hypothetical protein